MIRLGIVFLTIAVLAGLAALLPVAADWQMLSSGASDGTGRGVDLILDLWRSLVGTWQSWGIVSGPLARVWIADGVNVRSFLQVVSMTGTFIAWSLMLGYFFVQRPKLLDATTQAMGAVDRSELEVENLLLDPDLQVFGEPVSKVGQDLRSVRSALRSIKNSHVL